MKVLTGISLPISEKDFLEKLSMIFPRVIDIKVLLNYDDRFKQKSLQKLAEFFNVKGEATMHNGGSDALTTSQV